MRFTVRRATVRDMAVLRRQRDGMFRDMGRRDERALAAADRAYVPWARKRLRDGTLVGFLAVLPDRRVAAGGCVWLQEFQPGTVWNGGRIPYLMSMYTEPEFRGKGLATRIVKAATAWCRKRGYPKMFLHASPMGRGVYRRLGWERTWQMEILLK